MLPANNKRNSKTLNSLEGLSEQYTPEFKSVVSQISAANDSLVGATVVNRYEIISVVGIGGWSIVYKAFDKALNRTVAIKALHPHLCVDQNKLMRFQREAESASKLVHPNIAVIYDCGQIMPGRPFISMEFIDGCSLAELLRARSPLSTDECLSIFEQTCDGIDSIHKMGMIHRDLKPSNIKLTKAGQVKILDFGLAKWILQDQEGLTMSDETLGTPTYMSPEQCMDRALDARSDVYSLGCILYEAITGTKPFAADNGLKCMQLHVQVLPPRFRAVNPSLKSPPALEQVVFKALAKNPKERFLSVEEFKDALQDVDSGEGAVGELRSFIFWRLIDLRKKSQLFLMAGAIILSLVVTSLFFISSHSIGATGVIAALTVILLMFLIRTYRNNPALPADSIELQASKNNESEQPQIEPQRQLLFPDSIAGNIYLLSRSGESTPDERAKKFQNVSGAISVPLGAMVELADVPLPEALSLQVLANLKPDDLTAITLTNRELTDVSIEALNRLTGLQTLNLEGTNVSDSMLSKLRLPNLTTINLKGTLLTDAGLDGLSDSFPKLCSASFRDTQITDSGIAAFLLKIQPSTLDLSETQITDSTLVALSAQLRLINLKMTAVKITNHGLAHVAQIKTLETLGVCQTSLDDGALEALCKMAHLTYLNINHTQISTDALAKIRQALPTCEIYR